MNKINIKCHTVRAALVYCIDDIINLQELLSHTDLDNSLSDKCSQSVDLLSSIFDSLPSDNHKIL